MKKTLVLLLVLAVGGLAVSYCGRSSRSSDSDAPTVISGPELSSEIGELMVRTTNMDTVAMDKMGISSVIPAIAALSVPEYTGGWWTFTHIVTEGSTTVVYDIRAKAYNSSGEEITVLAGQSNTDELRIIASASWGSTRTYQFGTETNPLIFDGVGGQSARTLNGSVMVTATDSEGHSFSASLVYDNTLLDDYGIPYSNSPSFSFSSSYYETVGASINYTSYHVATISYNAPVGLSGTSYNINLISGDVSGAGL